MNAPEPSSRPPIGLAVAVACGLLATAWRYRFLEPGTLELLAPVMRAADPAFLPHDFYTWAGSVFGSRTPFITLFGMLARVIPFDLLYLGATALANVGLALVSHASARALFPSRTWAPRVAAAAVCCVPVPAIGGAPTCFASLLTPEALGLPLLLASFHFGVLARSQAPPWRRGLAAGLPATLAVLLAPGLALPSAALLLAVMAVPRAGGRGPSLRACAVALLVLLPSAVLVLAPVIVHPRSLADETFVAIVATHHAPARYSPAYAFASWTSWGAVLSMLALTAASARGWGARSDARPLARAYLVLLGGVVLLALASYVFVDRWPWRAWLLFTPLRCVLIPSWIGLLLAAGTLAEHAEQASARAWLLPLCSSLAAPLLAGPCFALTVLLRARTRGGSARGLIVVGLTFGTVLAIGLAPPGFAPTLALMLVIALLIVASARRVSLLLATALCVGVILLSHGERWNSRRADLPPRLGAWLDDDFHLRWRSRDHEDDALELAREVSRYTPPGSVILTPPAFGEFRLISRRAIVIDFDGLPDHDLGVGEWGARMFDCYGPPTGPGRASLPAYEARYAALTDAELGAIGARYRAHFAVVSSQRPTKLRVLLLHGDYALVVLP